MNVTGWQRTNIQLAAAYLREKIAGGAFDSKTTAVYEGLLEVLDPGRRAVRLQREAASAATAAVPIPSARERRTNSARRTVDRRAMTLANPVGVERRSGRDRRNGRDRRGR